MSQDLNWLEQKARAWALDVVKLYHTPVPPALQPEKTKLLDRAKTIKNTVEKLTGPLDALQPLNDLGFVWIAGGVAIAAAAAAITYWYTDYKKLTLKIDERSKMTQSLISSGVTPERAAEIVGKMTVEKGMFSDIKTAVKYISIAALVWAGFSFFKEIKRG